MTTIPSARAYVNNMDELEEVQKKYLKNLLNSGKIVPEAIIGSSLEDLIEIVNEDSLRPGNQEQVLDDNSGQTLVQDSLILFGKYFYSVLLDSPFESSSICISHSKYSSSISSSGHPKRLSQNYPSSNSSSVASSSAHIQSDLISCSHDTDRAYDTIGTNSQEIDSRASENKLRKRHKHSLMES